MNLCVLFFGLSAPLLKRGGISPLVTSQAKFNTTLWGYEQKLREKGKKYGTSKVVITSCLIRMS
jgi:hypothetical protein